MNEIIDVIIIGAGPAGCAAAMQLKRYSLSLLLFECSEVGGLLRNANLVENYPGFPEGISGVDLVKRITRQLKRLQVYPVFERVQRVSFEWEQFTISTDKDTYQASRLVIASGTIPVRLSGLNIPDHILDRIFYEVYPLRKQSGKEIAIIGAGDAAFDYALNLGRNNRIIILNRTKTIKSLPLLVKRAQESNDILYYRDISVLGISEAGLDRLMVKCLTEEGTEEFSVDFVIAAIGRVPNIGYLSEDIQPKTELLMSSGLLYYVGDVKNDIYRQTAVAAGDGIRAAMEIYRSMKGTESEDYW